MDRKYCDIINEDITGDHFYTITFTKTTTEGITKPAKQPLEISPSCFVSLCEKLSQMK